MKLNKKVLASLFAVAIMFSATISPVFAQSTQDFGFEYGTALNLGTKDLRESIMNVINILMSFLGIIAIIIILAGGFKWMTAAGSDDKIGEAKKLITGGIAGLAIILASYAIAFFVLNSLMNATR